MHCKPRLSDTSVQTEGLERGAPTGGPPAQKPRGLSDTHAPLILPPEGASGWVFSTPGRGWEGVGISPRSQGFDSPSNKQALPPPGIMFSKQTPLDPLAQPALTRRR